MSWESFLIDVVSCTLFTVGNICASASNGQGWEGSKCSRQKKKGLAALQSDLADYCRLHLQCLL